MALGIRRTFGFADYESGERRGSDTDSYRFTFRLYIFLIYHHSLILLIDFTIYYY